MRTRLGWIATLIFCLTALVAMAQAQPTPVPPCVPVDGCPPANEWYTYRYNNARTGVQPYASDLSDPAKVSGLGQPDGKPRWQFPPTDAGIEGGFRASPIVVGDTVFIGGVNGRFYALDAATGARKWQYPPDGQAALLGSCDQGGNGSWGRYGIYSSATFAVVDGQGAVIFGAPDPDPGTDMGRGSARLFALRAFPAVGTDPVIWKSDVIAHVGGCTPLNPDGTPGNPREQHERIAYSPPLVLGNRIYVGVHNAGDDPIQNGKVIAVDLNTGHREDNQFTFVSTGTRGGGVWNALATDGAGVYFTTGNTRCDNEGCQPTEPTPNHGLSMIRVNKASGRIIWKFQPVPFPLDDDPDWAAGATVMSTSCGELIASVQKDGWSYAVDAGNGTPGLPSVRWQFPPTGYPFTDYEHTDDGYRQPGAAWNDVFIVRTGGEARADDRENVRPGYGMLHALNACATTEADRVRWIADIADNPTFRNIAMRCEEDPTQCEDSLGAPTVTGGIVFIGTDKGYLVVFADPSVGAVSGLFRCSNVDYLTPSACTNAGYTPVPSLIPLTAVAMPDGGNIAGLRKEAALAKGRVFVATLNGHVYMLNTGPSRGCLDCCGNNLKDCLADCSGPEAARCHGLCEDADVRCVDNCGPGIACVPTEAVRP